MKRINRQTNIFIFELLIAITFFALSSSVCVQFFVKAHSLSNETNDINIAMSYSTGYIEKFINDPSIYQLNQEYVHYYDKNWHKCHQEKSVYSIKIYCSDKDSIETIHVRAYRYQKKIYSITSDQYIKEANYES